MTLTKLTKGLSATTENLESYLDSRLLGLESYQRDPNSLGTITYDEFIQNYTILQTLAQTARLEGLEKSINSGYQDFKDYIAKTPLAEIQDRFENKAAHPDDHIVIVGAGPAGLFTAYNLIRQGYTNITVLERNPYVGGKSITQRDWERGALWIAITYEDVIKLLETQYGLDLAPFTPERRIITREDNGTVVNKSFHNYIKEDLNPFQIARGFSHMNRLYRKENTTVPIESYGRFSYDKGQPVYHFFNENNDDINKAIAPMSNASGYNVLETSDDAEMTAYLQTWPYINKTAFHEMLFVSRPSWWPQNARWFQPGLYGLPEPLRFSDLWNAIASDINQVAGKDTIQTSSTVTSIEQYYNEDEERWNTKIHINGDTENFIDADYTIVCIQPQYVLELLGDSAFAVQQDALDPNNFHYEDYTSLAFKRQDDSAKTQAQKDFEANSLTFMASDFFDDLEDRPVMAVGKQYPSHELFTGYGYMYKGWKQDLKDFANEYIQKNSQKKNVVLTANLNGVSLSFEELTKLKQEAEYYAWKQIEKIYKEKVEMDLEKAGFGDMEVVDWHLEKYFSRFTKESLQDGDAAKVDWMQGLGGLYYITEGLNFPTLGSIDHGSLGLVDSYFNLGHPIAMPKHNLLEEVQAQ